MNIKKFVITWNDLGSEECRDAKIYAYDKEEAQEIALQFLENETVCIIDEM